MNPTGTTTPHFEVFNALGDGVLRRTAHTLWHTCDRYIIASTQGPAYGRPTRNNPPNQ